MVKPFNMEKSYLTSIPGAIIIGSLIISFAILFSNGVFQINKGKIQVIVPSSKSTSVSAAALGAASPQPAPSEPPQIQKITVGDGPILGSKDAKVTLVEFSDYECPFCKRHFDQTWPDLKKNYIDSGKVKLVYRNLPLPFHQNAEKEAEAALCARDQGGDDVYFKFHDQVFTRTTSNGTGFALEKLAPLATELGLNSSQFQQCLDSGKFKDYVAKDLAYANQVGANGTPTFFIGKSSSSGQIDGTIIVGAQPYSVFQSEIDALLK